MASVHAGHRARMRERYLVDGAQTLASHELLEVLLFHAIPQKDTNPLAHALLDRFGSLEGVFSATKEELCAVSGVGERIAAFLLENGRAARAILSAPLWEAPMPTYDNYTALGEFFVSYFEEKRAQATVAMLLDGCMRKIALMEVAPLDYDSAGVRAGGVIARAMDLGATVVVFAHNHPHGPAYPSHGDVVSSQVIEKELVDCGLLLLEHYVIAGRDFVGFHHRFGGVREEVGAAVLAFIDSKEEARK